MGTLNALPQYSPKTWCSGQMVEARLAQPAISSTGPRRVARHLIGVAPQTPAGTEIEIVRTNGEIALMGVLNGTANGIIAFEISGDQVIGVRALLNPDKLAMVSPDH